MPSELALALQDPQVWLLAGVGFVAQMFDGALGMGFGAISSTVLAAIGLPREIASATVNGAKIFTGIASGAAHFSMRNIDRRMLLVLLLAGGTGGFVGANLLAYGVGHWIGVLVSGYLVLVGFYILSRAFKTDIIQLGRRRIGGIGAAGGMLEALVGVWGPLVTSNLVAMGASPRHAVGTGNVAETFVAAIVFTVLVHQLGFAQLTVTVLSLLAGALVAAPIAANVTRALPRRSMMIAVGSLVILLSVVRLIRDFS